MINWKRVAIKVFVVVMIPYLIWWKQFRPDGDDYSYCKFYTETMNGGVKILQGRSYEIILCGVNGIIQPENFHNDEIRLQIFSADKKILAERIFHPLLGMGEPIAPIIYGENYLAYDTKDQSPSKRVDMPPTWLDWVRAKLPRVWPWYD